MVKILKNIARGCRCRQSTIDHNIQKNPDGASAAVNGARTGNASFVTLAEESPWWEIDLGTESPVDSIVIYNWDRENAPFAEAGRSRSRFLQVWGSSNGTDLELLYDRRAGQSHIKDFGGVVHGPLYIEIKRERLQCLRLTLSGGGILHLDAVQVFAEGEADIDTALLDMFSYANELSLKVASRIFSALNIQPSELMAHSTRLGVTLRPSAVWFIFNQLMEGGRIKESQQFLAEQAEFLGLAANQTANQAGNEAANQTGNHAGNTAAGQHGMERDAFTFDRLSVLEVDDPHYWIGTLPEFSRTSYRWIDQAYRFKSHKTPQEIDWRAPILYDSAPEKTKRIYFSGGCEFSYAGFFLRLRGYEIFNTFLENSSSDPVAEFLGGDGGQLIQFQPDLIILSMEQPFKQLLLKTLRLTDYTREEQLADLRNLMTSFDQAIAMVRKLSPHSKFSILSHITYSSRVMHFYEEATFANLDGDPYTLHELGKAYDLELGVLAHKHGGLLLDFEEMISKFGKSSADGLENHARVEGHLGGHPELAGARMIANTIDGWISALHDDRPKIKLIVLDLDNTMWDGIFREDGVEYVTRGIRVAHCYAALHLAEQGILLALCSKNNAETAVELKNVIESQFPDLQYKIVAMRVNWLPKSENIKSIVKELNIGLDSVAFFDDQAFERAEVAHAVPQVRVFTDADLLQVGRYAPFLPKSPISTEGRARAGSYITQQTRRAAEAKYSATDFGEFLVSCEFELATRRAGRVDVLRVAELFQRTNQQNVTLRRTGREFIDSVVDSAEWHIWCCELSDKFGDYGMIGAILVEVSPSPQIVELAFSCRAMGKGLEKAFLQKLAYSYQARGVTQLRLPIQKTDKNKGMITLIKSAGFVDAGEDQLILDLRQLPTTPVYDPWVHWGEKLPTSTENAVVDLTTASAGTLSRETKTGPDQVAFSEAWKSGIAG